MEPIKFKGSNVTFAKNQPEYLSLLTHKTDDGRVTSCWGLSFFERLKVLLTGKIWLSVLTFNKPLQPQRLSVKCPFTIKHQRPI